MAPIIRDRWIDANRAALWQAQLERNRVEPEIRAQLILFVRDGAATYWDWVAAGASYRIANELLKLALVRQEALEEQVEAEEKAPIDLVDNRRIIVSREAKQIDAERKLRQAAVKLSLFLRDDAGVPVVLDATAKPPEFPPVPNEFTLDAADVSRALANRPELADLNFQRQQLDVALRQAENERLPNVDAGLLVSQDVGEPTSSKRDKSPAEVQALVTLEYAVEQRKALGKARAIQGKLTQLQAKARFVEDKIVAEVRNSRLAIQAAVERVERARESFELAQRMLEAERDLFMEGQSTLLNLNLREGQAADAAAELVLANLDYYLANVDYAAALGLGQ
jgi:outer membrane protein TolC